MLLGGRGEIIDGYQAKAVSYTHLDVYKRQYHDKDGYNGLCFVQRRSPYGKVKLVDEDWEVNLAEEKSPDQEGYIVATKRLTKAEHWEDFEPGELVVFAEGKIAYSNKRDINV